MGSRIIRAVLVAAAIAAAGGGTLARPQAAHAGGLQLGLSSAAGWLRDSNNGGSGSPVVLGGTDIDGPAEDVAVNPTGTGSNVKIAFTGHSGQCVGLNPSDTSSFQLVDCGTGIGTVFRLYTINGGQVFDDNYADAHRGGEWDLTSTGGTGAQLIIGTRGSFFQRWRNCSGGCL
jgi:hypothetical protein